MAKKAQRFCKGDVILTHPKEGFWGIAVVLDDGVELELSKGRMSYPMCHIALTACVFDHEIAMDEVPIDELKPLVFQYFYVQDDGTKVPWKKKTCIDIYTTRNLAHLPILGNIDPLRVWSKPLSFRANAGGCFLCGDVGKSFGAEAVTQWKREHDLA